MQTTLIAVAGSGNTSFFTSLGNRISPIGILAICLAVLAIVIYVALLVISKKRRPSLASILEPYQLTGGIGDAVTGPAQTLTVPILTRPADRVQTYLANTKFGQWLASALERSGWRLRTGEFVVVWAIGAAIFLILGWLLAGFVGMLIVLVLAAIAPLAGLEFAAEKRSRLFTSQLPDVLKLTASSLRAGFSLVQGLESVTRQIREPSKGELQRVLAEARLGRPIDEAMESAAERIHNKDFTESVVAIRIQQETGGNLAALFDTLADTMVQRLRMRREVRALTAEGRLSAYILGLLPLAIGLFIFFVNRAYIMVLFHTTAGKVMLVGGLVLAVVGFFWMYRTVKIET